MQEGGSMRADQAALQYFGALPYGLTAAPRVVEDLCARGGALLGVVAGWATPNGNGGMKVGGGRGGGFIGGGRVGGLLGGGNGGGGIAGDRWWGWW